jgi:hypothetical protein
MHDLNPWSDTIARCNETSYKLLAVKPDSYLAPFARSLIAYMAAKQLYELATVGKDLSRLSPAEDRLIQELYERERIAHNEMVAECNRSEEEWDKRSCMETLFGPRSKKLRAAEIPQIGR